MGNTGLKQTLLGAWTLDQQNGLGSAKDAIEQIIVCKLIPLPLQNGNDGMAKFSINLKEGNLNKDSEVIVGIDLGTTNSLVAYIKDGKPVAVKGADGKNTLVPSVLHFAGPRQIIVGEEARQKLETDPRNTIYSVKRLMGKSFGDVKGFEHYFGYTILDEDSESLVKIRVQDAYFSPIELSAEILKALKHRIEAELEATVSKAVITVPAYFNDTQRQATRDAGKLAGLEVLRIVNEPTAASLAYGIGLDPGDNQTIAVYDLGGGTFDISILEIHDGIFEVLSTNGDTFLGGDDLDKAIMDHWLKEMEIPTDRLTTDKEWAQSFRLLAERAKKTLSKEEVFTDELEGVSFSLDRGAFNTIIQPLVDRTLEACRSALADADKQTSAIDQVVMVGGSTRVPLIQEQVSTFFGRKVHAELDPDEVVALGAAIQADVLAGKQKDILLLDVTPLSLGIETVGGLMDVILPRNSKVPSRVGRRYTTSVDGQKNLKVAVYQGERDLVEHNRKLGAFILKGIPPMAAGLPKIEIQFILDADGILKVKAKELRSEVEQEIEIRSQYGISEEEMAKMLLDSIAHAEGDMQQRALLEARNEGRNIVLSTDRFLKQNESVLSDEQKETLTQLNKALSDSIEGEDKDAINQAMERINTFASPLAHEVMDYVIATAMKGKKVDHE